MLSTVIRLLAACSTYFNVHQIRKVPIYTNYEGKYTPPRENPKSAPGCATKNLSENFFFYSMLEKNRS